MSTLSLAMVRSLDEASLLLLYGAGEGSGASVCGNEWTVRAVFSMLGPVEQQIVLRLACCGAEGCAVSLARRWVNGARGDVFAACVAALEGLRCVELAASGGGKEQGERSLRLGPHFLRNLRRSLGGGTAEPWRTRGALKPDKRKPTAEQLAQWMVWRWNNVLLYLIGDDLDESAVPPESVTGFLVSAGLMAAVGAEGEVEVTGAGVDFLLKERHEQVWALVAEYVRSAPKEAKGEIVALVLTLAYAAPGVDYAVEELSGAQKDALGVLFALGLVYRRNASSSRFYPTTLGVDVAFGSGRGDAKRPSGGGSGDDTNASSDFARPVDVIVQTNFQVLAYTDATVATSKLVLATLNLFADLTTRLPNLVVGTISRDAVKRCVARGIRVPQIVKFLTVHAHPVMRTKGLPQNVTDQMALWAGEGSRVGFTDGVLVSLNDERDYDAALRAAADLGAKVHWKSAKRRSLFVDAAHEDEIKRRLRKAQQGTKRKASSDAADAPP